MGAVVAFVRRVYAARLSHRVVLRPTCEAGARVRTGSRLRLIVGGETLLAALLGGWRLGHHSFWLDEAVSARLAALPTADFVRLVTGREANMALHSLLLRGMTAIGQTEAVFRSVSVVGVAASVPAVVAVAGLLYNRRTALIAGMLLAVNAYALEYAREARGYGLVVLLTTVASYTFLRAVDTDDRRWWAAWVIVSVLAGWTHFYALLVVVAQLATLALRPKGDAPWRSAGLGAVVVGVLVVPLMIAGRVAGQGALAFIESPTPRVVARLPWTLLGSSTPYFVVATGFVVLAAIATISAVRQGRSRALFREGFAYMWFAVPVVLTLAGSISQPLFYPRYLIICVAPLVMLVARGVDHLRRAHIVAAATVIAVALSLWPTLDLYHSTPNEDWRTATGDLLATSTSADGLMVDPAYEWAPFTYYVLRSAVKQDAPDPLVPPASYDSTRIEDLPLGPVDAASVDAALRPHRRVWDIEDNGPADHGTEAMVKAYTAWLRAHATVTFTRSYRGLIVTLYQQRP